VLSAILPLASRLLTTSRKCFYFVDPFVNVQDYSKVEDECQ